jgi:ABC-type transport system involved in Fe-S cluster assembly fused permease/ATPase subunit
LSAAASSRAARARVQVALFNNQAQEVTQYDAFLSQYQAAMVDIEKLAATLNAGQAAILNVGIVAALLAAVASTPGGISPGDLILIQGMLLQLWAPLQFLGWFFRRAPATAGLALHDCDCVQLLSGAGAHAVADADEPYL